MDKIILHAKIRNDRGKSKVKKLRKQGLIPAALEPPLVPKFLEAQLFSDHRVAAISKRSSKKYCPLERSGNGIVSSGCGFFRLAAPRSPHTGFLLSRQPTNAATNANRVKGQP